MSRRLEELPAEEADAPTSPAEDGEPESGTRDRRVLRALLGRAERARKDPTRFFDFVMKEEKTHGRLRAAAHQRVLFDFVFFHQRSVVRMPVGFTKTFCMASITLYLIGVDPTERGAVISASREQAEKPLSMVQDYIEDESEQFAELHLTFPELRPSRRVKDPWTQHKLVVDRPPGIRDPSLVAVGEGGKLPGARLSWIIVDDVLNEENTRTPAARAKVKRWFDSTVVSRKDVEGSRIVVTNTPWDPDDLTYALEKAGWPTITMSIRRDPITIAQRALAWDSGPRSARRSSRAGTTYRLAAHDSAEYGAPLARYDANAREWVPAQEGDAGAAPRDVEERIPLWPEVYPETKIEQIRTEYAGATSELNQLYYCRTRTDDDKVREQHVEKCKRLAIRAGVHRLVKEYRGPWPVVTGVDLAIGQEEKHDRTAFFTFACVGEPAASTTKLYRNLRLILDVDVGRYRGRAIVDKVIEKTTRYGSIASPRRDERRAGLPPAVGARRRRRRAHPGARHGGEQAPARPRRRRRVPRAGERGLAHPDRPRHQPLPGGRADVDRGHLGLQAPAGAHGRRAHGVLARPRGGPRARRPLLRVRRGAGEPRRAHRRPLTETAVSVARGWRVASGP